MEHRVRVQYTEPMLRQAVRIYVWRGVVLRYWWLRLCAIVLLLISFVASWSSDMPVISGISIAVLAAPFVFLLTVWRAHFVNTVGTFRSLSSPEAEMVFRDSDLTITSALGSVTLPWQRFTSSWQAPGFWMLFLARNQFITLPLANLPPDVLRFVSSKLPHPQR
jgi:hypothetical protein